MRQTTIGIVLGVVLTLLVGALIGYLAVISGGIGWQADIKPGAFETWAAHTSLRASMKRAKEREDKSPIPDSEENLMAGAKLYMANCSFCHGTPAMGAGKPGIALYQAAPQFGLGDGVTDDPVGKIHSITYHGIRLTGMPAFGKVLPDQDIWKMVLFLKNQDKLPPSVQAYWKSTNPALKAQ